MSLRQLKIAKRITPRDSVALNLYLKELSKEEVLTPEEELRLIRAVKEGDEEARERIIRANLRFVVSVAKQYMSSGIPLDDLISEGNLGLIKAIENFDETRGFKFISYAVWWIRQAILNLIAQHNQVNTHRGTSATRILETAQQLEQELGRPASSEDVARELGISPQAVNMALSRPIISINEAQTEDAKLTLEHILQSDTDVEGEVSRKSLREAIINVVKQLEPREAFIIKHLYGLNGGGQWTIREIASELNLSPERIRQLHRKALLKIKKFLMEFNVVNPRPKKRKSRK
ncbi:MAG: sigma-70 family RNA polymerase sigma factor [Chlorobi bacterium]|nr:sigma-70 family RNA polymerase sigma factor [Chlorobiota bacterium]